MGVHLFKSIDFQLRVVQPGPKEVIFLYQSNLSNGQEDPQATVKMFWLQVNLEQQLIWNFIINLRVIAMLLLIVIQLTFNYSKHYIIIG